MDTWREDGLHYFEFWLRDDAGQLQLLSGEPASAVFVMAEETTTPFSAVIVEPAANGGEPKITNLRDEEKPWQRALDEANGTAGPDIKPWTRLPAS